VAHQLKSWVHGEGAVRLSEGDGPPAHTFVDDDDDDDDVDDEPLAARAERLQQNVPSREDSPRPLGNTANPPQQHSVESS